MRKKDTFLRNTKIKKRVWNLLCYLVAIGIPLWLVFSWHKLNTLYPRADGASFYETAQNIYLKTHSQGLLKGIEAAYLERGGRPTFFPVIGSLFIALNKAAILPSVTSTMLFVLFLLLTYAYLFAREFLSPPRALICTVFLGTLHWVIQYSYLFWSETTLIVCCVAALYHLKKSDFFTSFKHSMFSGIWIGVGLLIRPIEFFLAFMIPLIGYIFLAWRREKLRLRDLALSGFLLSLLCVILGIVLFSHVSPRHNTPIIVLGTSVSILTLLSFICAKKVGLNFSFFSSFMICSLLVTIWWIPGIKSLFQWLVTLTTVSPKFYHLEGMMTPTEAIVSFFANLGGFSLLLTSGLFIVGFGMTLFRQKDLLWKSPLSYFFIALSTLLPPILALSLSADIDFRRAFPGFAILHLTISIFALQRNYLFPKVRLLFLLLFTGVQILGICSKTFGFHPEIYVQLKPFFKAPSPFVKIDESELFSPARVGDPSEKIFAHLKNLHSRTMQIAAYGSIDTSILSVLAKRDRSGLSFNTPTVFSNLEEGYEQLLRFPFVMLDVTQKSAPVTVEQDPYTALGRDIKKRWEENRLSEVQLSFVSFFFVNDHKILLLKTGSRLSPGENFALPSHGGVAGSTIQTESDYRLEYLNDDNEEKAFGALPTIEDTLFYISRPEPYRAKSMKIVLFSPAKRGHIKDLSVIATNDETNGREIWQMIKARIESGETFDEKITLPSGPDSAVITIELDQNDPHWRAYKTFGLGCFSKSKAYHKNYVSEAGQPAALYLRELQIAASEKNSHKKD